MIPEFLRNRKTYILSAIVFTIIGVFSLSFAFFRAQTTNQPTNSTVMVETVDIAGSTQKFTVYYDNNDGFFETGLLNISSTYTDIMKFRVVSGYSLGSQNISINWKSVTSTLTKANTSYNLYSCTSSNYSSATLANVASLCTRISPISNNYLPASNEKTRLTSASDINLAANATNYYIATINIPVSETGKSFDGSIAVKHNADHILTINPNGGTLGSTTSMTLGTGDSILITNITKTGQMVSNWTTVCTECQINGMNFTMGTSDATITSQWVTDTYNYEYNGTTGSDVSYQEFTAPQTGIYTTEAWGAQGGNYNSTYLGGYGAYTKGEIFLNKDEKLYIYVGAQATSTTGGYNGGGNGLTTAGRGGGGSTDIRYFNTTPTTTELTWNDTTSLNNRIMVAAGGGGGGYYGSGGNNFGNGGSGGGIEGAIGTNLGSDTTLNLRHANIVSTQTSPGYSSSNSETSGAFGSGGYSVSAGSGGGGGYYGGGAGVEYGAPGGGGSSYISGHVGCNSINSNLVHTGSSLHNTNKYFKNTEMIDGNGYSWTSIKEGIDEMPNPSGGNYTNKGNTGNGYARITLLNYNVPTTSEINNDKTYLNNNRHYSFIENYQLFTVAETGTYKIETWGAQGGNYSTTYFGGYGAYTKGEIFLNKDEKLYIYVGAQATSTTGGYNGGGNGLTTAGRGGGGSTDIRYFNTTPTTTELTWNDTTSLNNRIMVAAGGGGGGYYGSGGYNYGNGGGGGGIEGAIGTNLGSDTTLNLRHANIVSTQTSPGYSSSNSETSGAFGSGGYSVSAGSGGGGGYYGGGAGVEYGAPGGGGSSYISGHTGCTTSSLKSFINNATYSTIMIDGNGYAWVNGSKEATTTQILNPKGGYYSTNGNIGDGYAKITKIS